MARQVRRYVAAAVATGFVIVATFATLVLWLRTDLRAEIHARIIERTAAVLYPMAVQQLADSDAAAGPGRGLSVAALLRTSRQPGMLAVAVFDATGNTLDAVPSTQSLVELPVDDFLRLQSGAPVSRYHPAFPLEQYFPDVSRDQPPAPVLEVLLALPGSAGPAPRGFVRYFIDARPLALELAAIDHRTDRQTYVILGLGALLIALVVAGATFGLERAQRLVDERTDRLTRTHFELALAAKASAIGQIASHLIHGMQESVAGLRAIVSGHEGMPDQTPWQNATDYAERLQKMIHETVALLADTAASARYEYSGPEIAALIRERHAGPAATKGVDFSVGSNVAGMIDSHRASILCLIAHNLVQNALTATPSGARVSVALTENGGLIRLAVRDEGSGVPTDLQDHLFLPGRSGRPGGSGLGLALSRLLARQIGADLKLERTGPDGTLFAVEMPRQPQSGAA